MTKFSLVIGVWVLACYAGAMLAAWTLPSGAGEVHCVIRSVSASCTCVTARCVIPTITVERAEP